MKSYKKPKLTYIGLLLFLTFCVSTIFLNTTNIEPEKTRNPKSEDTNPKISSPNDWTFLVYLDADNNLESFGISDFLEMSSVGSDANIRIVVQFDRISGYATTYDNWVTTKRYYITSGMTPTIANALADMGELNMGNPTTLSNFITWGTSNYPSTNYALILWNHGGGWKSSNNKDTEVIKSVCWDDTNGGDCLTQAELKSALATAGVHFDLIGFDACLMAMAEVDYQIKNYADVRVSSEETEPGAGWPYNTILAYLKANPTMNANSLGQIIVNRYIQSYAPAYDETLSAVDLTQESTLSSAINAFAQILTTNIDTYRTEITNARIASEETYAVSEYVDLYDFAYEIKTRISNVGIQNAAQNVMNAINTIVIEEAHGTGHPNFHGITIYFPSTSGSYVSNYQTILDFTSDLSWDELLLAYYSSGGGDDNYEENDADTSAYDLVLHKSQWLNTIAGYGIQADDDWYEIYANSGETLYIDCLFSHAEGDIDIRLYNSVPTSVASSTGTDDDEHIVYSVPTTGTYYIKVYYDNEGNQYNLRWYISGSGSSDDNYEENEAYTSAYDLVSHEDEWLSTIDGNGIQADDDWYEIYATEGETLYIECLFSHAEGDIDIRLYNSFPTLLESSVSVDDDEYIEYSVSTTGTYYIMVYYADAGNEYNLRWNAEEVSSIPPSGDDSASSLSSSLSSGAALNLGILPIIVIGLVAAGAGTTIVVVLYTKKRKNKSLKREKLSTGLPSTQTFISPTVPPITHSVCTKCGAKMEENLSFCTKCGTKNIEKSPSESTIAAGISKVQQSNLPFTITRSCLKCGSILNPEDLFCTKCGTKVFK